MPPKLVCRISLAEHRRLFSILQIPTPLPSRVHSRRSAHIVCRVFFLTVCSSFWSKAATSSVPLCSPKTRMRLSVGRKCECESPCGFAACIGCHPTFAQGWDPADPSDSVSLRSVLVSGGLACIATQKRSQ